MDELAVKVNAYIKFRKENGPVRLHEKTVGWLKFACGFIKEQTEVNEDWTSRIAGLTRSDSDMTAIDGYWGKLGGPTVLQQVLNAQNAKLAEKNGVEADREGEKKAEIEPMNTVAVSPGTKPSKPKLADLKPSEKIAAYEKSAQQEQASRRQKPQPKKHFDSDDEDLRPVNYKHPNSSSESEDDNQPKPKPTILHRTNVTGMDVLRIVSYTDEDIDEMSDADLQKFYAESKEVRDCLTRCNEKLGRKLYVLQARIDAGEVIEKDVGVHKKEKKKPWDPYWEELW